MSDMKPKGVEIELNGKNYNMLFNLNVIEQVVEKFGDISDLMSQTNSMKAVKWLATEMINEEIETWNDDHPDAQRELMTEKKLGRAICGVAGVNELRTKVQEAICQGLPESAVQRLEDTADELIKNAMATQTIQTE